MNGSSNQLAEPLLSSSSHNDPNVCNSGDVAPTSITAEPPPPPPTTTTSTMLSCHFVAAVTIAILPMFEFGYNTGALNAPATVIFPAHTTTEWSIAVSAFCVGGIFGANMAGRWADRYGRRQAMLWNEVAHCAFGLSHVLAPGMVILTLGRVGVGACGGAATVLVPTYLSEIAPTHVRGSVGTLTQLACVLGILASILWALPFCTEQKWRIIFVPLPCLSLAFLCLALPGQSAGLLPESPRWLLLNYYIARGQEARATIRRFRRSAEQDDLEEEVEREVTGILTAAAAAAPPPEDQSRQQQFLQQSDNQGEQQEETVDEHGAILPIPAPSNGDSINIFSNDNNQSFVSFLRDPKNRIPVISSILFPISQQLSGINAVFFYSTTFFAGVIPNPLIGTILAFGVNVVATIVAVLCMDRFGRKTLLSWSAGGMLACCIVLTLSLKGVLPNIATVVCIMVYICFFELGLGCIPFFLASEMVPPAFLGRVQSTAMSANWASNVLVGMFFPWMNHTLGAYAFVPFAMALLGTLLYAVLVLPETRGKPLDQVRRELEERRAARESGHHQHQPVPQAPPQSTMIDSAGGEVRTAFV